SCGGHCGNMACGASCSHGAAPTFAAVPADARWTSLHVTGMHCGGCARRIEGALAGVSGVLDVEVDLGKAEVRVATAAGSELQSRITDTIDGLGYQVVAN
ncbi:MAG TPA: heavy-metal-associated domain-containing protein, partial [Kofleriaceae bacterium]|nr:heavy-metal-associated domain-containing protein [Kofleriaceae bacterium]